MALIRTRGLEVHEWPVLLIALLPVSVFVVGYSLFDVIGIAFYAYGLHDLATSRPLTDPSKAISSGLLWGAMANFYLITSVGVLLVLIAWKRQKVRGLAAVPFNGLAAFLAVLGIAFLLSVDLEDRPLRAIFLITFRSLQRQALLGESFRLGWVQSTMTIINALSIIIPAMLCAFLPILLLKPRNGWTKDVLYERAADLRILGTSGSVFMVAGVLHMFAWMSWAPDLLGQQNLQTLVASVTLYWGAVWTLMLAMLYLPVLLIFNQLAGPVMAVETVPIKERDQWLTDYGISFRIITQLPQLLSILAPLISAPLTKILGNLPQLLGK
ncbi:MAG: hypothetical protein ACK5N0_11590 [Synechococcaceae cyanobacterium]